MQLLSLRNIHLTFGGTPLLEGADLAVSEGDRICLVGRNGSGKSTLMRIAAGLAEADSGERFVHPGARVRYLAQDADFTGFPTVLAYVEAGLDAIDDPHLARRALEELGLDPSADPARLSGGEARRVALARVLAPSPDVLLLDEPTNHLDLPAIEWLESKLAGLASAIVLISHDRRMLETLSRSTVWLDRGRTRTLDRGFSQFEAWRDKLLEEEEAERHKLDRRIAREEQWMYAGGVTARRKRNMRRVAELAEMRRQRSDARKATGNVRMAASEAGQSGRLAIEAGAISKSYGDRRIVADFSTRIVRGDRVGLVGPNGAGKTTLLSMLTGQLAPDGGEVKLGTNLEIVTLDQRREALEPDARVADVLTGGGTDWVDVAGARKHVASYLSDFLFLPEQARSPVKVLSGGEKARLLLARALAKPSNLLVLDEPTNDLDLETLDLLQELLADYSGTLLLVSHDRDFLDRVVTSVIASEGNGRWIEYAGGYSDMLAQRRGGAEAGLGDDGGHERQAPKRSAKQTQESAAKTKAKRKLSFREKHALETLPARIAGLEAETRRLLGA
ncbi:MAG: ABC-F family ATP-binding cassette domain-containing protein [Hyphomicrobiaceae bacterium]